VNHRVALSAPRGRVDAMRFAAKGVAAVAGGALVTLGVVAAVAAILGYRNLVVLSGSMTPTIRTGDLVVARPVSPLELKIGDIVTFRQPGGGRLITHRVRRLSRQGSSVAVTTRGDANTTLERWTVRADGHVGRIVLDLPKLGYAVWLLNLPFGRIFLVVLPTLLIGAAALRLIWQSDREIPSEV
jgi:signal peptidase I